MNNNINILIVSIIILSVFTMITAADIGKKAEVETPTFASLDKPHQDPIDATTKKVFVGFRSKPGKQDRLVINGHKGRINNEFNDIGAFSVDIPANRIDALSREQNVLYIEEDQMLYPLDLATSELVPDITNGLYGLITTKAIDVHADGITGTGITACIADTGIDPAHPDQSTGRVLTQNFNSQAFNLSAETHATHVAGTIIAAMNGVGVRGVAYNSTLIHARVLGPDGGYSSEVMNGVRWLVETKGCRNVGLSLGGSFKSRTAENFYKNMYSKGALIIAAAGNEYRGTLSYPAGYPVVLSVGALDKNNNHALFSNTGKNLDISAPGVSVISSVPFFNWATYSGTSMATPHVVGIASLVLSANPSLTNAQVEKILKSTATDLGVAGYDITYGYGIVNASGAVKAAKVT